ncbi:ABC transporter permease subunit [Paenibacillus sepulcri]|uniref:ABC transporter permease subunit n=2 Tax=Paenibacillus sepulcri TaxID=359917 RepID=A0ABS7BXD8_9BACL|nr:ABC transporter permease subunit [Paenibacillus sepulcri]
MKALSIQRNRRWGLWKTLKKDKTLLLMLLPAFLLILVFAYFPMIGLVMAFKQFDYRLGIFNSPWVGLDNFLFFFKSGQALLVTRNTVLYNLVFMFSTIILQVGFAIILSEIAGKRYKKMVQSAMFLPFFISWVVVASIVYNLLNFEHGILNGILTGIGMEPVNVYNTPELWKYLLVFFNAWKIVGYGTVIYLAAIVGIDQQIYESAEIDGANIFKKTFHITIPSIFPTIMILTLLAIGQIFRGDFGLFYNLVGNNGALFDATDIIDTFVFRALVNTGDIGMASAAGFYQSVMCFITILITNSIVKKANKDYALF